MLTPDEIRNHLHNQVVTIQFVKADGSVRVMNATLQEHMLPPRKQTTDSKSNPQVVRVWDVDKQDWRSIRWDRIEQVTV